MAVKSVQKRPSFRAEPALERLIEELMKEHGIEKQSDYLRGLIILDKARRKNTLAIGVPVTIPAWVMNEYPGYFLNPSHTNTQAEVLNEIKREEKAMNRSNEKYDEKRSKPRKSA